MNDEELRIMYTDSEHDYQTADEQDSRFRESIERLQKGTPFIRDSRSPEAENEAEKEGS